MVISNSLCSQDLEHIGSQCHKRDTSRLPHAHFRCTATIATNTCMLPTSTVCRIRAEQPRIDALNDARRLQTPARGHPIRQGVNRRGLIAPSGAGGHLCPKPPPLDSHAHHTTDLGRVASDPCLGRLKPAADTTAVPPYWTRRERPDPGAACRVVAQSSATPSPGCLRPRPRTPLVASARGRAGSRSPRPHSPLAAHGEASARRRQGRPRSPCARVRPPSLAAPRSSSPHSPTSREGVNKGATASDATQ